MANPYKNRTQSDNKNLQDAVGAQFVHVDGGTNPITVQSTTVGCRLLKVINNSKGVGMVIRTGSREVAVIATTTIEGTYNYGVYCESGIQVDVSGSGSATLVYATE